MTHPAIERARRFCEARLDELRNRLSGLLPRGAAVVACGSYARREASDASDFDYFAILPAPAEETGGHSEWAAELKRVVAATIGVEPAKDGAFATIEHADRMVRNIGGQFDDNQKLTRRMLFLLEGVALGAEAEARALRRALLERYVGGGLDDGLARFLLDDVIRYYRTVAVDYEFKTREGDRPKPWGLRNVKLMFSRRLLYASGLFAVAAARDSDPASSVARIEALLDLPPIPRIEAICGQQDARALLGCYDRFLDRMTDRALRARLESLAPQDVGDADFASFKAQGAIFAREIVSLFGRTFEPRHPIHRTVLL